ncbi:MAG: hypothetical protein A2010_05760 [Nitrospirae bacterium GWD2_57_9]|nr:MAG: hypothetical protein A2010_05760 [Nitrospirae bacterium GWD2_57_9]OGW51019.1 MAG: hypothetical protein A2078_04255 [Nitrospirae bacterium GWC2_57_9]
MKKALLAVLMVLIPGHLPAGNTGSVSGVITDNEISMEGCKVCFFDEKKGPAPARDSLWWRIPDQEYDGRVGADGHFEAEVPAGDYVVASVKRNTGQKYGPPLEGEHVFISRKLNVKEGMKTDIGIGQARVHKANKDNEPESLSKIEGRLVDVQGNPFKGGFVIARPGGYLSKRTGDDGKFSLYLPEGGTYRLVARNRYSGYA